LGGYPPAQFLSDLARDIGLVPARAGSLVANAVARCAANRLLQAGAFVRGGRGLHSSAFQLNLSRF
jgi:hypothetical protein